MVVFHFFMTLYMFWLWKNLPVYPTPVNTDPTY